MAIRFDSLHGPNVKLFEDGTIASWHLERSGGVVFSEDPLRPRDCITVTCEGSGRVRVGCTTEDPLKYKAMVPDSVEYLKHFSVLNEIRFHKRACSVKIYLNSAGNMVTSSCGVLKYDKIVHQRNLVWIALYIMFGEVKITATKQDGSSTKFSCSHGINIDLGDDRTTPTTVCPSPGAFCAVGAPMHIGQNIYLRCQPVVAEKQPATNFYLKMFVSPDSPVKVSKRRTRFTLSDLCATKPPMTVIETLRKNECHGEIRLSFLDGQVFEYRTANNKVNSYPLPFETSGNEVYVYLELYRVSVRLSIHKSSKQPIVVEDVDIPSRYRTLSSSSSASYQYNHVTFGSRYQSSASSSLMRSESIPRTHPGTASGEYMIMGPVNHTSSCPAALNRSISCLDKNKHQYDDPIFDEVDGSKLAQSIESLSLSSLLSTNATGSEFTTLETVDGSDGDAEKEYKETPADLAELRRYIRRNWTELINSLQTEAMGDLLFEKCVLSHSELDKVRRTLRIDGQEANRQILDILFKRGIDKEVLGRILEKTCDVHLKPLFFKQ